MKKIIYTLLLVLSVSAPSMADSYFTMGVNDTLRIEPSILGNVYNGSFSAHFDGRLDTWSISMTCPSGLSVFDVIEGPDMTVPYIGSDGFPTTYNADLDYFYVQNGIGVSSFIPVQGYWDYNHDNIFESYGTVKWGPGDYSNMVTIQLSVDASFRSGVITISGCLSSTNDTRGGMVNPNPCTFQRSVFVYVGYKTGDVNGDGLVNIVDISILNGCVLHGTGLGEFEFAAADIDGNGILDITDVTLLTNIVLTS